MSGKTVHHVARVKDAFFSSRVGRLFERRLLTRGKAFEGRVDGARLWSDLLGLAEIGGKKREGARTAACVNRIGYSDLEDEAFEFVAQRLRAEGLEVRADKYGNLFCRLSPSSPADSQIVLTGSHVDSVPDGGMYDGDAGVIASLEAMRALVKHRGKLKRPVELVIWRCEESSRFASSCVGSSLASGKADKQLLDRSGKTGGTLLEELSARGFDGHLTPSINPKDYAAYIELHAEQGNVLEHDGLDVGVVTGIAAPARYEVTIKGRADHSGATPMTLRKDALYAFSSISSLFTLAVEGASRLMSKVSKASLVATFTNVVVTSPSPNKVPGKVTFNADLRSSNPRVLNLLARAFERSIARRCESLGLEVELKQTERKTPVILDKRVTKTVAASCRSISIPFKRMPSGAGHDAMVMQAIGIPTGMVFVKSCDGVSHNPDEFTPKESLSKGADVLLQTLYALATQ